MYTRRTEVVDTTLLYRDICTVGKFVSFLMSANTQQGNQNVVIEASSSYSNCVRINEIALLNQASENLNNQPQGRSCPPFW